MMCDFSCLRCWSTFPGHFQPRATSLVIQKQLRNFQTTAVTLVGESTYLSLIASSNKQDITGQSLLVEIPINLDIKVKVMQRQRTSVMRNHCQNKHMNFDISKLVQCILATQVQLGNKGIELVQSPAKKQWMDAHNTHVH